MLRDCSENRRLNHESQGQRRSRHELARAAFAVHPERITSVALQPDVEVGNVARVSASDHIEDAALGRDHCHSAVLFDQQGHGRLRRHVIGDDSRHDGHRDRRRFFLGPDGFHKRAVPFLLCSASGCDLRVLGRLRGDLLMRHGF
jgi:hypothetical protein